MKFEDKVWLITGSNKGIGAAIAKEVLAQGYGVVSASRKIEEAEKNLGKHPNLLFVKMDVTNEKEIAKAVELAMDRFGRIDVLVNNAGYGLVGFFEEMSPDIIRKQFETNVFGTMNVTRAVLPIMREQKSGMVISVSSTSGIRATPGGSLYSSTKFALEGWSEGMNLDMKDFGIHFMILEPGPMRTDFSNKSSMQVSDLKLDSYKERSADLIAVFEKMDGTQSGDPEKLAKGLLKAVTDKNPPMRLLISKFGVKSVADYYKKRFEEADKWKAVSEDSDFD